MDGWRYNKGASLEKKVRVQIPVTDRSKSGIKRSIVVVDGKGVPLGIVVYTANRHDMKMTKATLQSIVVHRPEPTIRLKRHTCVWIKAMTFQKCTSY